MKPRLISVLLVVGLAIATVLVSGCPRRDRTSVRTLPPAPVETRSQQMLAARSPLPSIDSEPVIRVRLATAREHQDITLLQPGRMAPSDTSVAAGTIRVPDHSPGSAGEVLRLRFDGDQPGFRLPDDQRSYIGELVVMAEADGGLVICSELPLEAYLVGVMAREVSASWPAAALEAQAIAARSYAVSAWQSRHQRSWHLDASERVDMAYAGYVAPGSTFAAAVNATRGKLLMRDGHVLPAFFHAGSGGRTETSRNVWPERRYAGGRGDPAQALPVINDPWAETAATQMRRPELWNWQARLPMAELQHQLKAYFGAGSIPGLAELGPVIDVQARERFADSGRVRQVDLSDGRRTVTIEAARFRLATDPRHIRSTLWTNVRRDGAHLVINGRGYGHGVGLPQTSAWAMAKAGHDHEAILMTYYRASLIDQYR